MFRSTLVTLTLALPLVLGAAACGDDDASCGKVVDHVGKLMGMEVPKEQRAQAIAKCEKEPASKRACALKATSVEALMACK